MYDSNNHPPPPYHDLQHQHHSLLLLPDHHSPTVGPPTTTFLFLMLLKFICIRFKRGFSRWRSISGKRCILSMDVREKSRSTLFESSKHKRVPIYVMMPIDSFGIDTSGTPRIRKIKSLTISLKALKLAGVHGIAVEVWWGIVERFFPHAYNWSLYEELFKLDNMSFPLFCSDWNADEEILLLEGIEMYGLANWNEVAEHVGTKSKSHCIEHYNTIYMNSPCFPLPDMTHVMGKNREELLAMARGHGEATKENRRQQQQQHYNCCAWDRKQKDGRNYFAY